MVAYKRAAYKRRLRRKLATVRRTARFVLLIVLILGAIKLFTQIDTSNASVSAVSPERVINVSTPSPTPTVAPTPTPEEMMKALPHGELVWKTYGHESTWGKFDDCRNQGLYNGFGYAQHKYGYQCFSSLEEVATKVSKWFDRHLQTMTVRQALCYYNTGEFLDDCNYADYTLSL